MLGTLDPHSSFFDPREYAQMRERQEGRYYGIGVSISGDRRRHHRDASCSKDRRPTRKASAAATCSRRSPARTPRAGPSIRRCASCAGRRAPTSTSASGARGYEQLIPIQLTRDEVYHPDGAGVFHDRRDDRLHPDAGLRREHRSRRQARAARSRVEGDAAAAVRRPRQPGRPARSGDQGRRTSSCPRAR